MKKINFTKQIILLGVLSFILTGCGKQDSESLILATIGDYNMTIEDFKEEVTHSPYAIQNISDKKYLLELAIRKQVLIQEAQKQGLDRNKSFMKTIERYWEQTLIRDLLTKEAQKIQEKGLTKVQQEKILKDWADAVYKKADIK